MLPVCPAGDQQGEDAIPAWRQAARVQAVPGQGVHLGILPVWHGRARAVR